MKDVLSIVPSTLSHGESTVTNPCKMSHVFSNYFASVNDTAKKNIKYSHNYFSEYLKHQRNNSMFTQPTIISSLSISEASGPFSIPNKILILWKEDISKQPTNLFKLSSLSGFFPFVLITLN